MKGSLASLLQNMILLNQIDFQFPLFLRRSFIFLLVANHRSIETEDDHLESTSRGSTGKEKKKSEIHSIRNEIEIECCFSRICVVLYTGIHQRIDRHATSLLLPRFDRRDEKRNSTQQHRKKKIIESMKLVLINRETRKSKDCNCEDEDKHRFITLSLPLILLRIPGKRSRIYDGGQSAAWKMELKKKKKIKSVFVDTLATLWCARRTSCSSARHMQLWQSNKER